VLYQISFEPPACIDFPAHIVIDRCFDRPADDRFVAGRFKRLTDRPIQTNDVWMRERMKEARFGCSGHSLEVGIDNGVVVSADSEKIDVLLKYRHMVVQGS